MLESAPSIIGDAQVLPWKEYNLRTVYAGVCSERLHEPMPEDHDARNEVFLYHQRLLGQLYESGRGMATLSPLLRAVQPGVANRTALRFQTMQGQVLGERIEATLSDRITDSLEQVAALQNVQWKTAHNAALQIWRRYAALKANGILGQYIGLPPADAEELPRR
ncbi:MAG TPA: hypothetical protein VLG11_04045 [Candidatus Saccharimonadales bacterium]|nr:hypothetical protein [Candidatus Saccharimonadales bacterium]